MAWKFFCHQCQAHYKSRKGLQSHLRAHPTHQYSIVTLTRSEQEELVGKTRWEVNQVSH